MTQQRSVLETYPEYVSNIGIEVHVQLATNSKIFCTCPNQVAQEPNSNICPVCAGYPGTLPVLNKQVIDYAIMAGLGTHCTIEPISMFDRKHYFYPDLPKGYQITQQYKPVCTEGHVEIRLADGTRKKIRLIRIHIEEDAGKNIHTPTGESFVNLNRAGTPLLEIVSYPDIDNAYEAREYLKALRNIVVSLGVCSGNMEDGAFRADTNISVRKKGASVLGTRCEMKNINSFKFIGDAIDYEIERHIEILEAGGSIKQETRLWDTKNHKTVSMRSKEEAADYRYFNDPDLPTIKITDEEIAAIKQSLPELPYQRFDRLVSQGLSDYEADILIDNPEMGAYYDQASANTKSKTLINWVMRDVMGYLKEHSITLESFLVSPEKLALLIDMVDKGIINASAAKKVFDLVAQSGGNPTALVKEHGLEQIGSVDELEAIVKKIVAENPENVALYKAGKERVFGFFVGQAMKQTAGKGNPHLIQELVKKHLES
jgi:aspartyl-tRNA(Asn)/glutamyl-tRNA(Gln) amidotransferase subunit B